MATGRVHHSPARSSVGQQSDEGISSCTELWEDVQRQPELLDGPHPLATIAYTADARRCLLLFTAIVAREEISDRVLNLTAEVIRINSANYTAWHVRRLCLLKLNKSLLDELEFVRHWAEESEKNYQVWHQRRWVLLQLGRDCNDKAKAAEALYSDGKNYSAWSHRQWLVQQFGLWEGEMEFVNKMIQLDARNNSAWNYRHFLLCQQQQQPSQQPADATADSMLKAELMFALLEIKRIPHNECPYRYAQCLLRYAHNHKADGSLLAVEVSEEERTNLLQAAMDTVECVLSASPDCRHALYTKAILCEYQTQRAQADQIYQRLCVVDPIRKKWWQWKLAS
eukprot:GHVS01053374.1.p1 GENE.GHVS01053374.1~~GHVS01053374.1.p1  ORF type:complete len:354 (-),score=82.56 GHVS01053374.1:262-1278(-)